VLEQEGLFLGGLLEGQDEDDIAVDLESLSKEAVLRISQVSILLAMLVVFANGPEHDPLLGVAQRVHLMVPESLDQD
jgi:hypothetical protein